MSFLSPERLVLLVLVLACAGAYAWAVRRRVGGQVRYPTLDLAARAAAAAAPWRRHVPAALYLLALSLAAVGVARPTARVPMPDNRTAVMLSVDVSGSMEAHDIVPSRIGAAKRAATEFVRALPRGAKVGLVAFSSYATVVTPLTEDHDRVVQAIRALRPRFATAIGDGLLEAVYALPGRHRPGATGRAGAVQLAAAETTVLPPAAVVLLSDGGNNRGTPPEQAARIARDQHVTVYTVGLGAPETSRGNARSRPSSEPLDEQTLKTIAEITGGTYHRASSAAELTQAYTRLGRSIGWTQRPTELSGVASALAAMLLAGTLVVSLCWHRLD